MGDVISKDEAIIAIFIQKLRRDSTSYFSLIPLDVVNIICGMVITNLRNILSEIAHIDTLSSVTRSKDSQSVSQKLYDSDFDQRTEELNDVDEEKTALILELLNESEENAELIASLCGDVPTEQFDPELYMDEMAAALALSNASAPPAASAASAENATSAAGLSSKQVRSSVSSPVSFFSTAASSVLKIFIIGEYEFYMAISAYCGHSRHQFIHYEPQNVDIFSEALIEVPSKNDIVIQCINGKHRSNRLDEEITSYINLKPFILLMSEKKTDLHDFIRNNMASYVIDPENGDEIQAAISEIIQSSSDLQKSASSIRLV